MACFAEGLRRPEERDLVVEVVEQVMKVKVDVATLYATGWDVDVAIMLNASNGGGNPNLKTWHPKPQAPDPDRPPGVTSTLGSCWMLPTEAVIPTPHTPTPEP